MLTQTLNSSPQQLHLASRVGTEERVQVTLAGFDPWTGPTSERGRGTSHGYFVPLRVAVVRLGVASTHGK